MHEDICWLIQSPIFWQATIAQLAVYGAFYHFLFRSFKYEVYYTQHGNAPRAYASEQTATQSHQLILSDRAGCSACKFTDNCIGKCAR